MRRLALVVLGFGVLAVPDVQAASFTIDGTWSGVPSGFAFTPTVETFVVSPGVPFEVGRITSAGSPVEPGVEAASTDLSLSLIFDNPARTFFTPTFSVAVARSASTASHTSCADPDVAPCGDVVSFPAPGPIEVLGTPYTFTLLGVGDRMNGPLVDQFVTQAGQKGHTALWGVFTEAPPPDASSLPEPSSLLLLGSGLGLLRLRRRRRLNTRSRMLAERP